MTSDLPAEFPETAPGVLADQIPIVAAMGIEVLAAERGRAVLRLPFEPNINHVGMIYAGSLVTLAEVPGGVLFVGAFDVSRYFPIVGDLRVRFARPAMSAVLVDARMTDEEIERVGNDLDEHGKAKFVLDQELVDYEGNVVATTSGTYFGRSFPGS